MLPYGIMNRYYSTGSDVVSILKNFIKGIVVGIATLVPGVSGGTMAIVVGIYDRLIHSVSSFFKDWKKNTLFLFQVGVGVLLGILLFNRLMLMALDKIPYVMSYLFMGIIIGGLPVLYKKAMSIRTDIPGGIDSAAGANKSGTDNSGANPSSGTNKSGANKPGLDKSFANKPAANKSSVHKLSTYKYVIADIIFLAIGFCTVLLMTSEPDAVITLATGNTLVSYLFLIFAGLILAIALVLPGISFSFMLLVLGIYDITLKAIKDFNIPYLIPLGLGVAVGTFATARILENLLAKHTRKTYMLIIGFVLGSLVEVFPGIPQGWQLVVSAVALVLGFIGMLQLGRKGITD